jgi:hypothetical protein
MVTAGKFVQPITICLAYHIQLDVDVTGNRIFTVVCGSFWRVDKIQNDVTMEIEVPK